MNKKLSVAIVHDYIKEYGGAERVLEEFIKIFPDADIFTSLYAPEFLGPHKERFKNYKIHTSWFQKLPIKHKIISPLRLLSPLAFKSLNLKNYDVILVSQTGAYFPNYIQKGNAKLICYTHTPPRYLYGLKTARNTPSGVMKGLSDLVFEKLRKADFKASKNVDIFISNSEEVRRRIKKFYNRDAKVIYPPVEARIKKQELSIKDKKEYYLAGGRLARAKGMDIIVDAFIKNKKPLKIFGRGFAGYEEELQFRIKNKELRIKNGEENIEFVGEVNDEKKFELMSGAKAYVFASFDEDFGITPVESMGVGTPVIAYNSGGVKETVIDGKTGVFYEPNTPESLNNAIKKFETLKINSKDCIERAEKFSEKEFDRKIMEVVKNA
jgi:glycosyltransferase involved in cell wall biosynthesis